MARRLAPALALAASLALAAPLWADASLAGTREGDFLKLGSGARAVALGEAVTADPVGLSDQAYNPAGLSLEGDGVEFGHTQWFAGAAMEGFAARLGLGAFGGLGMTYGYLGLPAQQQTVVTGSSSNPSANYAVLGSFTPSDMVATLGWGRDLGRGVSLGMDLKATQESVVGAPVSAVGVDLGLLSRVPLAEGAWLSFGLAAVDLGPATISSGAAGTWPEALDAGLAYHLPAQGALRGSLSLDYDLPADGQAAVGVGAELELGGLFTPRLGYRFDGIFNPWSLGLGVKAFGGLKLDLAMVPAGELGTTYRASLGYQLGKPEAVPAPAPDLPLAATVPALLTVERGLLAPNLGVGVGRLRVDLPPGLLPRAWSLRIAQAPPGTQVLRRFEGKGAAPAHLDWDGKDDDGVAVSPGAYVARLRLVLSDGAESEVVETGGLTVLAGVPGLRLRWDPRSQGPDQTRLVPTPLLIEADAVDPALGWCLQVSQPDGSIFRSLSGSLSPSAQVIWDGKGDQGQDLISNQRYGFQLWLTDAQGQLLRSANSLEAIIVFGR